jgi:hypothetical protein
MSQIGTTRDQPYPNLAGYGLKAPQSHSKALIFGIAGPFPDVEAVNKKGFADVCLITLTVQPSVMQERMEAIHAAG